MNFLIQNIKCLEDKNFYCKLRLQQLKIKGEELEAVASAKIIINY